MTNTPPSDQDDFQHELETLRLILKKNLEQLKQDPFMGTQVEFWLESARFMEKDIEIWEDTGNTLQHQRAMERMRKVLDALQQLIDQMSNHSGEDGS